jgi:hypothetical protein
MEPMTETLVRFDLSLERLVRMIFTEEMIEHLGPAGFTMVEDAEIEVGGLGTRDQVEAMLRHLAKELATPGSRTSSCGTYRGASAASSPRRPAP